MPLSRIHGVSVTDNADYFYELIDQFLKSIGQTDSAGKLLHSRDIVDIIDGYKGRGYGLTTRDELEQILEVFSTTGVPLDPVYTLKGVRGMLSELRNNPGRFAGKRILFIHTGGVFGLYDGRMKQMLYSKFAN